MAQRDTSQGFGFVYLDISKILAQRAELEKNTSGPINTGDAKTINFNKDPRVAPRVSNPTSNPVNNLNDPARERSAAAQQIRENLDRLQSLHHKLHAMLEELNHLTDKKKRS